MQERVLARVGRHPAHDQATPARIDLAAAERVSASVDRLLAAVPREAAPIPVQRWLLAAERLLPLTGEHDRARLLQARAAVDVGRTEGAVRDAAAAGELFEQLGEPLAAATNFAVAASAAARDGHIPVALETAVRALVALGWAVREADGADRDPIAEAHLATRLGVLCRQLFDYPRALRFYELALDALDGCAPDERGYASTTAVAELLLAQASELDPADPQQPDLLGRAEQMATGLLDEAAPTVCRRVHGPRLLGDVRCALGRPEQAWPLLLGVLETLAEAPDVPDLPDLPDAGSLAGPARLSAGRCLLLLGRPGDAAVELDRAVELLEPPAHPGEPHLAELLVALRLRSAAREGAGDLAGALEDARRLADLLWSRHRRHVAGFMDQVWSRAGAEEERRDLQERTEALLASAEQDPLTGLANRRALGRFCDQLAPGGEVSLVLVDVDHFKRVNDRHGHAIGDAVLRALGDVLTRSVRTMDLVARWGGEEFLIALPGGSGRLGADAADRVCRRVRTHPWRRLADGLGVTVSAGVARGPVTELDDVLARADAALYRAKHAGRDRVVVG